MAGTFKPAALARGKVTTDFSEIKESKQTKFEKYVKTQAPIKFRQHQLKIPELISAATLSEIWKKEKYIIKLDNNNRTTLIRNICQYQKRKLE